MRLAILFLSFFVGSASSVWQQLEKCLLSNREDVVSCPICGVSVQKVSYKRHMDIHDKDVAFNCYICHKSFKRKDNLKRHLKSHLVKTKEMNKQNWIFIVWLYVNISIRINFVQNWGDFFFNKDGHCLW